MVKRHTNQTAQETIDQLEEALATLPVIEQAKGMLMVLRNWNSHQAFRALREISQNTNVKLHDVAAIVVASGSRERTSLPHSEDVDRVLDEVRKNVLGRSFNDNPIPDTPTKETTH